MKNKQRKSKKCEHDFEGKKAIAPVISMILLLGLAVALGTGVYLWQVRQTGELGEGVVRYASGILDCYDLNFNVYSKDGCNNIKIKNSGYFNIDSFVVRSFSSFGVGSEVQEVFVSAQEAGNLNVGLVDAEKVEIIPIIKVDEELIGCKDKVREVNCDGLDDIQAEACETADSQGTCNLLDGSGIVTSQECCDYLSKCCN